MRRQTLSALLLGGLFALTAAGQTPGPPKVAEAKKAATLEDDIARAVQSHPDVRVAEAEAQLANAKLQQTKQAVAQKVAAAKREKDRAANELMLSKSRLEVVRRSMELVHKQLDRLQQLNKAGSAPASELNIAERELDKSRLAVLTAEQALEADKAKLATAEADYEAVVGKAVAGDFKSQLLLESVEQDRLSLVRFLRDSKKDVAAPTGSVPDRIRAAMARPVVMEGRDMSLADLIDGLKKAAGLDVVIRFPKASFTFKYSKQNLPLSAWLELIRDDLASDGGRKVDWYIRDYGLTLSEYGRPEGAMSLGEFLKTGTSNVEQPKADPKK